MAVQSRYDWPQTAQISSSVAGPGPRSPCQHTSRKWVGWGWNLFGTAGQPWWQLAPEAIPALQAGLVLIGFVLALQTAWRHWSPLAADNRRAVYGLLPIAAFQCVLTYGLIWFFTA